MYEGCMNRLRFCVMNAHDCVVCPIESDCDGLDAVMSQAADAIKELDLLRDRAMKRLCERRDGNMSDVKLWKLRCPECGFVFVVGTARVLPDKSVKELKKCPCGAVMIEDESLPPYNELPRSDDGGG